MQEIWDFFESADPVWYWGTALLLVFPLILLTLAEASYVADRKNPKLTKPINTFKNFIVPLLALVLLLIEVLGFDRNSLTIKIIETIIWVVAINAGLTLFTELFLVKGKTKAFGGNPPQLFLDIFRVFMVLLGGAIVLSSVWNQELSGLVTALGLGSFVLGLALQDTLGNLFSGIALVYEKPFSVGDFIKVDDLTGQVIEMNWRAVHMMTRQKELIVMPHLMIAQSAIMNYSSPTKIHMMQRQIGFSYDDAPNKVKEALLHTCLTTPGILQDPLPEIKTINYDDSGIVYEIEFGISDFLYRVEITDELMTRLWYTAKRNNLDIPFPQRTIHYAETAVRTNEANEKNLDRNLDTLLGYLTISEGKAQELKGGTKMLHFGKREIVFSQGDPTGSIFVLMEGQIELSTKKPGGEEVLVQTLEVGDFFGEVALLSKKTSAMTARASQDSEVIVIGHHKVMQMVKENPRLAFKLGEVMEIRKKALKKQLKNV